MPVVILCGGEGTRMKEETEFKPKPLVNVGNKPIIWHIMKIYSHYGYKQFILALGYKGWDIKQYFLNSQAYNNDFRLNTQNGDTNYLSNGQPDDFQITFAETGLKTNTGERVRQVAKYIDSDNFMLTYGDAVSNVNIDELIKFHNSHDKLITITGVHPPSKWGQLTVGKNMIVNEFKQKPRLTDYVNGGFMIMRREVLDLLEPDIMIEDDIIRLSKKGQVVVFEHNGFWQAMDTYAEMKDLNKIWEEKSPWKVWAK